MKQTIVLLSTLLITGMLSVGIASAKEVTIDYWGVWGGWFARERMRTGKNHCLAVVIVVLSLVGIGAATALPAGAFNLAEYTHFIQNRQARRYPDVPKKVLAFYYPWYGTPDTSGRWVHYQGVDQDKQTIASSTHYPAIGPYDSHDPEVVDYHMRLLKEAGIDGIIVSWWGINTFEDRAMPLILDKAQRYGIEVTIYLETEDYDQKPQRVLFTSHDLHYILNKYSEHPSFFKVNGKPVVFVYGRVMSQLSADEWMTVIQDVESDLGPFLLIADGINVYNMTVFDGSHTYNPLNMVTRAGSELRQVATDAFVEAVCQQEAAGKISTVTIIPGYDDRKIRKPGMLAERRGGKLYTTLWEAAIAANPDWVLITSFNEWHEGSEIEPSNEYGDTYIRLTRAFATKFKSKPASRKAADNACLPLLVTKGQQERLRARFGATVIGVLPDLNPPSPVILWLAKVGLTVRILTHNDVVEGITADDYPVLLYAGGEHYTNSVEAPGDVDNALVEYLRSGGCLVVAPSQPWPFYYTETGTVVATKKLGIPVHGGWESPPPGRQFVFRPNPQLVPEVARISFPRTGDLRWRPARPPAGELAGEYYPIISLYDRNGTWYGDGACYVKHENGGRVIYIWFRLMDQPGSGELLCDVFELAAENLER